MTPKEAEEAQTRLREFTNLSTQIAGLEKVSKTLDAIADPDATCTVRAVVIDLIGKEIRYVESGQSYNKVADYANRVCAFNRGSDTEEELCEKFLDWAIEEIQQRINDLILRRNEI